MPKRSTSPSTKRSRWTEAQAHAVLEAQASSGLSERELAAREGFHVRRLQRWRHRLAAARAVVPASKRARSTFVEVPRREAVMLEVLARSGRVMRVPESIAPEVLRRLVLALEDDATC